LIGLKAGEKERIASGPPQEEGKGDHRVEENMKAMRSTVRGQKFSESNGDTAQRPTKGEPDLADLDETLKGILEAIFQQTSRRKRIATGAALNTAGGAAAVGGITGLVGTLGTASTGTAIASLSGAAANSATLATIGGIVGGGMAAGGLILTGGGIGAGIAAGIYGKRKLLGKTRSLDDLEEFEVRIVLAITAFRKGIRRDNGEFYTLSIKEKSAVKSAFLDDLLEQITNHLNSSAQAGFPRTLASHHLKRLTNGVRHLRILMDYWT